VVAAGQFVVAGFRAGLEKMLFPRGTEGSNPSSSSGESVSRRSQSAGRGFTGVRHPDRYELPRQARDSSLVNRSSSGESDELPPEQARSPSDLEVVRYWDLAATERTKLNDRTRPSIERSFSGAALLGMLLMSPLSSGLNIRHKSRAIAVAIVQIRLPSGGQG